MKLLIVGSDKIFAIENYYVKYLKEMNVDVHFFHSRSFFYDYYQKSIINKLLFKAGISGIYRRINNKLKKELLEYNPDIVWVFKGMEIYPKTLQWIKKRKYKLVNYNPDNPFLFSSKASGNYNLRNSIGLYDLHFTYHTIVQKRILEEFKIPTHLISFGFDISDEQFELAAKQKEVIKACFIGNPDKLRAAFLQEIANAGIEVDIYGNGWDKFLNHSNFNIFGPAYEDELGLTLRKYRVQLNLMRPHNPESHNMRTFEVPGVGGILLAPDNPDHRSFFKVNEEIFLYSDIIGCISKIKILLQLSADEANAIRFKARKRSIESGYTYKERTKEVYDILKTQL